MPKLIASTALMMELSESDLPFRVPSQEWRIIKNARIGLNETAFDVMFVHHRTGANVGCVSFLDAASPPILLATNLGKRLKMSGAQVTDPTLTDQRRGDAAFEFSFMERGRRMNGKTVVFRLERLGSDNAIVTDTWVENEPADAPFVLNTLL
jgi:hypothetical protein